MSLLGHSLEVAHMTDGRAKCFPSSPERHVRLTPVPEPPRGAQNVVRPAMGEALGRRTRAANVHFDCGHCGVTIFRDADAHGWSRVVIYCTACTAFNRLR
jgi:predicted RNA-binding Zn-ribbon protein involved in translation (DUF1610 family)